jgi:predicted RNase H-like HicB family nuclease
MAMIMEYPALFEPSEEGGFVVTFPDFDWGITQGETEQDARQMALDALRTMIREQIRQGKVLPTPSHPRGRKIRMIRLPVLPRLRYTWRSTPLVSARPS